MPDLSDESLPITAPNSDPRMRASWQERASAVTLLLGSGHEDMVETALDLYEELSFKLIEMVMWQQDHVPIGEPEDPEISDLTDAVERLGIQLEEITGEKPSVL